MTCSSGCCGYDTEFNDKVANRELKQYQKQGPKKNTKTLIDAISKTGVKGSILDIGGGIGIVPLELINAGFDNGLLVDVSAAYLAAAKGLSGQKAIQDRLKFKEGDFVAIANSVEAADVVTLDKSICCYEDYPSLVQSSARKAKKLYGIIIPRDKWWVKAVHQIGLLFRKLTGDKFRSYIHSVAIIENLIANEGLSKIFVAHQREWMVALYERQ